MVDVATTRALIETFELDPRLRLAILPADPELPLGDELDLQVRLEATTGTKVDLLRIDHAATLLARFIARDVRVLLDAGTECDAFLARAASEWFDFEPSHRAAEAAMLRRLAESGRRDVS